MKAKYKKWQFEYDFQRNKDLYKSIHTPASLHCGCVPCKNFSIAKDNVYPSEIHDLYSTLGIEIQKELYLVHSARKQPGLHYYSGAHVCFGHVLTGNNYYFNKIRRFLRLPEIRKYEQVTEDFSLLISHKVILPFSPVLDAYRSELFQLDFVALVPWVLQNEPEPAYG